MTGSFQKSSAGILASVLIGLIILSFMFTGYYSRMGGDGQGSDVVATVDREPIKGIEFQRALNQRMEFFKQMTGGRDLTPQQMEQFGLRDSVMRWLIEQKLYVNFANRIGLRPGQEEIANEIKEQPFFKMKEGDRFDVLLYKDLLARNGLTPSEYEKTVGDGLAGTNIQKMLADYPVSQNFIKDILTLQENALKVRAVQITKDNLKKHIPISSNEIDTFLKDPKNQEKLNAYFLSRKEGLDQAEQVKARHILLTVDENKEGEDEVVRKKADELAKNLTTSNFSKMADQETQDPSGKGKGGDLGWFGKGRMVPEFEKAVFSLKPGSISPPIKTPFGYHIVYVEEKKEAKEALLETYKNQMVEEILQTQHEDRLKTLVQKVAAELKGALEKDQKEEIEAAQKKYDLVTVRDQTVNQVDGNLGSIALEPKQVESLFQENLQGEKTFIFDNVGSVVILAATPYQIQREEKDMPAALDEEKKKQQTYLSNQLRKVLLDHLNDKAKIKTYVNIH